MFFFVDVLWKVLDLSRWGECLRFSGFIIFVIGVFYFCVSPMYIVHSLGGSSCQPISRCVRGPLGARVSPSRGFIMFLWLTVDFSVNDVRHIGRRSYFSFRVFCVPLFFLFFFFALWSLTDIAGTFFCVRHSSAGRCLLYLCPWDVCSRKPRFCVPSSVIIIRGNSSWFILISVD